MAYASVGTFAILVLLELVTYRWRDRTGKPELKEVYDADDIQDSELLELRSLA